MKSKSSVAFVLTSLIEVNYRRVHLYKSLVDRSDDIELKLLFMQFAIQSQTFMATLNKLGLACGADIHPKPRVRIFDTIGQKVKRLFFAGKRNMLIGQCESMEREAMKIYKAV